MTSAATRRKADQHALPTSRGKARTLEPRLDPESRRDRALWRRRLQKADRPLCVSLWSGAGGLDLGLERAGFDVVVGADHDEWACRTHGHNSNALVFHRNLDDPEQTRRWLRDLELPDVTLVAGGFPCQPYSRAGHSIIRHLVASGQRPAEDSRALAWLSFVAAVDELRPLQAIAENVPDMARFNEGQLLRDIVESLEAIGYAVDVRVLPARLYGVPQYRERLIIQAALPDIGIVWPEPTMHGDPTVADAIGDLPELEAGSGQDPIEYVPRDGRRPPEWAETTGEAEGVELYDHVCRDVREDDLEAFRLLSPGGTYLDIPKKLRRYDDESFTDKYKRLEWDRPSRTITAHIARDGYWYIHPSQHRTLSIREAARMQTFPDWFVFAGFPSNRLMQIGNAVPPLLGEAIGRGLIDARKGSGHRSSVPDAAASLVEVARTRKSKPTDWAVLLNEVVLSGRAGPERLVALVRRFPSARDAATCRDPADAHEERAVAVAGALLNRFGGHVPETENELLQLPGVTETSARMILALTHGGRVPRSTGTLRVAERVSGIPAEGTLSGLLNVVAARLVGFGADPAVNAALVDLARGTCLPDEPRCSDCPLARGCVSSRASAQLPLAS